MSLETVSGAKPPHPYSRNVKPFSLRLTADERARLTAEAGGEPLASYMRAKLLTGSNARPRRSGLPVDDARSLGQALALLGRSRLSSNLNQLAHLANIGALPVTPELESELAAALADIREIRRLLISALGLKPEASE